MRTKTLTPELFNYLIEMSKKRILDQKLLSPMDYQKFKDISQGLNLTDPYFDCSEIAEEYQINIQGGFTYKITPKEGVFTTFVCKEFNSFESFYNHYVFVKNDVVFDPRFDYNPVFIGIYFEIMRLLNPNTPLRYVKE